MGSSKLLVAAALAVLAAATAGRTLSSDPEWGAVPGKGTDVVMEELTLSETLPGDVDVGFRSDYFNLD